MCARCSRSGDLSAREQAWAFRLSLVQSNYCLVSGVRREAATYPPVTVPCAAIEAYVTRTGGRKGEPVGVEGRTSYARAAGMLQIELSEMRPA